MGEDIELEEGEAGYFMSNDDTSIDPDIALSHIDEKLQSVLAHFQKYFEGAENLGATYGAYGSFLPTYRRRRLPSIRSQPKGPQRVQMNITQSPYHLHREGAARSFSSIPDATLLEKDGTAAPRIVHSDKVPLGDDLVKNVFDLPSDQAAEKLPLRHQPSPKKSLNSTDQKTLKFRINVGSNKAALLSPLPDRLTNLLRDIPSEGKSMPALMEMLDHSARFCDDSNSKVGQPSGDRSKGSIDTVKDECGNMDRFIVKSSRNKVDHQQTSQSLVKDSLRYTVPPTNGLSLEMEQTTKVKEMVQTTLAPEDSWVACDRCEQWRLLPNGRTPDQFPETWVCSMLDWLPGMNSCNCTEDETTEALRALYQPPLPANQDNSQYNADRAVTSVSSVDTHYNNLGNPNVNSYNIANGSKKQKVKESSLKGSKSFLNMTSIPRNLEQGPVRRENSNAKQPDSGMKLISNSFSHQLSSSGEAKLKRNSKRVSDHVHPTAKKVKTEFGSQQQHASCPLKTPYL